MTTRAGWRATSNKATRPAPSEDVEQCLCAQYLDARGLLWFHVPNGGQRNPAVGKKLKAHGVKRGVPDIWIVDPPPGKFGLVGAVIELKRADGVPSDVTPEQREWLEKLKKRCYATDTAFGFDHFRRIAEDLYPPRWAPSPGARP
jgi:hypothetical protein